MVVVIKSLMVVVIDGCLMVVNRLLFNGKCCGLMIVYCVMMVVTVHEPMMIKLIVHCSVTVCCLMSVFLFSGECLVFNERFYWFSGDCLLFNERLFVQ